MPSGGSSQPQTVTQTASSAPWAGQQPFLKKGFEAAENIYNQGPNEFYPGQTFANPSAETLAGLDATAQRAAYGSPVQGAANMEAYKTLSGGYLRPDMNPYMQSVVESTKAHVLPGIDARFMSAGRAGSGLHGRAVGEGLGSALGGLYNQMYQSERDRMTQAMGQAPGLAQADYTDMQMMGNVGAQREAIAQKPISEAIARFDYDQSAQQNALENYMRMVSGNFGQQTTGTTQQFLPKQDSASQYIGSALQAAAIVAPFFMMSDERVKTDIKRVGETDDGLPVYTYRYVWGGPPQMGVMAQDVAEDNPGAVYVTPSGFLALDYSRL